MKPKTEFSELSELKMNGALFLLLVAALLSGLHVSSAAPVPEEEAPEDRADTFGDDLLRGYDCSQPRNVKDVGYVGEPNCESNAKILEVKNASYQVLQEEKYHRVNGTTCSLTMTRVVRYCGTYDHQTALPQANLYEVMVPVAADQCQLWYRNLEYLNPHKESFPLKRSAVNTIAYEEVGRTYVSGGEISCEGGDWKWGRVTLHRIIVEIQLKITLREESYLLSQQEAIAHVENVRLPCGAATNHCEMPGKTYLWEAPNLECGLAVARSASGTEVHGVNGEKVFVSTDNSLIRLIRQEAVSMCGRVVHSTNYPGVFLYEKEKPRPFVRPLEAGEVSLTLYIKNRDDFLYNNIVTALEEEFRGILTSDCQSRSQRLKRDFWQQHQGPGATTWLVAEDVFATAAGDVIYQYQCQAVLVKAVTLAQCYQALPVRLAQPPPEQAAGGAVRQLFLEPLTRRLTHQGIEVPCSRLFRPKYLNTQGTWIVAAPDIISASSPRLPPTLEAHREIFQHRPDWSIGGLYTEDTLMAAERYQEFARTSAAIGAIFTRQVGSGWKEPNGGYLSAEQVFPEFRDPGKWVSNAWARTRGFLHAWGEGAAIVFSLFAIGRIVMNLGSWLYGVAVLREMMGCTRHLVWTLCPNIFLLRQYREFNRAQHASAVPPETGDEPTTLVLKPTVVPPTRKYKAEAVLAATAGRYLLAKPSAPVSPV